MPTAPAIDDLFGHVPQNGAAKTDIEDRTASYEANHRRFYPDHILIYPAAPEGGHTADSIRDHVTKVMTVVREATEMPFCARELRTYTAMMPYLCEWLKNGEGDALLAEFRERMEHFGGAASSVNAAVGAS